MSIAAMAIGLALTLLVADGKIASAAPDELPTVSTVERDMIGVGERDTAARTVVALGWLAAMADRSRADEYSQARAKYLKTQQIHCQDEPGCDPSVTGAMSRFFTCRNKYEASPKFLRAVIDKYVPVDQQEGLGQIANGGGGDVWAKALALPPGGGDAVRSPSFACTVSGQFKRGDDEAAQAKEEVLATNEQRRGRARASLDAPAIALALADGKRANKKGIDTVYGVPIGAPLALPDCDAVGHREKSVLGALASVTGGSDMLGPVMVSPQNCLLVQSDGSTTIHWAEGALPSWVSDPRTSITTVMKGDVLVSVNIEFDSVLRPPAAWTVGDTIAVGEAQGYQEFYESHWKHGPENVAKAHEALRRKYGEPLHPINKKTYTNQSGVVIRHVEEPEWRRDGLHVKYTADTYRDTILIELDSIFQAQQDVERGRKVPEPTL